jgi:hypothetical protein
MKVMTFKKHSIGEFFIYQVFLPLLLFSFQWLPKSPWN